jgi:hypothetical protein
MTFASPDCADRISIRSTAAGASYLEGQHRLGARTGADRGQVFLDRLRLPPWHVGCARRAAILGYKSDRGSATYTIAGSATRIIGSRLHTTDFLEAQLGLVWPAALIDVIIVGGKKDDLPL